MRSSARPVPVAKRTRASDEGGARSSEFRSGILTYKKYVAAPTNVLRSCFYLRIQKPEMAAPLFSRMPKWLQPLLYCQFQHGNSEKWLCSIYQNLPADLSNEMQIAFSSVITLLLSSMSHVNLSFSLSCPSSQNTKGTIPELEKPWLQDGLRFVDEELKTYDSADIAVLRSAIHFVIFFGKVCIEFRF